MEIQGLALWVPLVDVQLTLDWFLAALGVLLELLASVKDKCIHTSKGSFV